ncbi:hypothetical protein [Thiomicrorhabdus xiamenensis]|uniref:Uncharacterized protein n=1 Tax=Thiomicrorhabdus xiamenensis TaxID=2739063 RepID=A0A7D4NL04_9GAMM|nr:hypothetical protein [Thiomicrorhabdus xiamenensis]QKI88794.1 hypothetical protein HQN79_04040 [Thiomicrorhabdus xiamenensis]
MIFPVKKALLAVLAFSIGAAPAFAANVNAPKHSCVKPTKPAKFDSVTEWGEFNYAKQKYHKCISDYVKAQNAAIDVHQQAAASAIREWNSFVQNELN